jgi:hypothetical protein
MESLDNQGHSQATTNANNYTESTTRYLVLPATE